MKRSRDAIGLDIGGTHLRIGWVDAENQAHDIRVVPSAEVFADGKSVERIAELIRSFIAANFPDSAPEFVAVGLPAVMSQDRKVVYSATNFPGMEGEFFQEIQKHLAIPVILDHDAYFLLAYDMLSANVQPHANCVGIYFGTGLGTAIFINRLPYYGKNGTAAELGHLPIPLNDRLCSCGNRGCIEMFSCGKALERLHDESFPNTPISDLFLVHQDSSELRDLVAYMAVPIASVANILDPDYLFVGGGIPNMSGFPKDALENAVRRNTRKPFPASNLPLIFSENRPEKGIIGAVIEGRRRSG